MNKILVVSKREYLAVIRKKSFWLSTLAFPILILIVMFISGVSSENAEKKFNETEFKEETIHVVDDFGIFEKDIFEGSSYSISEDLEKSISMVRNGELSAVIHYPKTLLAEDEDDVQIYLNNENILENEKYNNAAIVLVRQSAYASIDPVKAALIQKSISVNVNAYEEGIIIDSSYEGLIIPGIGVIIYFILVTMGTSFMLASVAEEKESRMIEIVLSSIKSQYLIAGKIIGLVGVIITQVFLLTTLALSVLYLVGSELPIDLSKLSLDPLQLAFSGLLAIIGFLILANLMIGAAGAMPTLKEAQSFSTIFILASVFPIYVATIIITDVNGVLAQILSYAPLTAPLVLLFRNAIDPLPFIEIVVALFFLLIQLGISFVIAFKLFEAGSLEYNKKIDLKKIFSKR